MTKTMKTSLLAVCFIGACISASAQQTVVKDAEKAMKAGKSYTEVMQIITPAMSDSETAEQAITYYIPGKAGFNQFDEMLPLREIGKLDEKGIAAMNTALVGGYENFMKALPLDTVIDAKGKVKTKYSKEILNTIGSNYTYYPQAGVDFYNAKDFDNAYKALNIFVYMSENPEKFKIVNLQPDSVIAQYSYYGGLAAYELDNKAAAAEMFKKATKFNPNFKDAWKNGMIISASGNLPEMMMYFAEGGDKRFGKEDADFTGTIINYYLDKKDYQPALAYLDKAIENDPTNAQYYTLKGVILEADDQVAEAKQLYQKALQVDPTNGLGNFQLGRRIYVEAEELDNNADQSNYAQFKKDKLIPLYKEAIKYLEDAYKYDINNKDKALILLNQLYYQTNDEAGMESVKERQIND